MSAPSTDDTGLRVRRDRLQRVYDRRRTRGRIMGVGLEASGAIPQHARPLRQPAYGEYAHEPEVEAQHERADQEGPADRFARRAQWPALFVLSLLEVAWLGSLAYVIHRFVLGPIFG